MRGLSSVGSPLGWQAILIALVANVAAAAPKGDAKALARKHYGAGGGLAGPSLVRR